MVEKCRRKDNIMYFENVFFRNALVCIFFNAKVPITLLMLCIFIFLMKCYFYIEKFEKATKFIIICMISLFCALNGGIET